MGVNGIYGLSGSGIDVESMVKVGMMSKQNEYDKMAQKFTKNEWIKADYLELNNKITTFNASTLSQYKMSNTMNARSAESSSSAVKVTANSTASVMSHKVDVEKLSTNAYLVGTRSLTRYSIATAALEDGTANQTSIKLADVLYKDLTYDKNTENPTFSGHIASVDRDVVGDGHAHASAGYVFGTATDSRAPKLTDTAFSFTLSDGVTKDENDNLKKVTISYTFGDLIGDNGKTFNDLVADINAAGLNVKASYDSVNDRFSFYNKQGGSDNTIQIALSDAELDTAKTRGRSAYATRNFFDNLGLYQSANGDITGRTTDDTSKSLLFELGEDKNSFAGENGVMKIDGVTYDKVTDNKVIVGGVTYTALNTTGTTDASGVFHSTEASTVSITQDTDSIIDKVKSFVTDYNKLLADLYAKYDEKPNSDYKPLTQAQKDQMKDDQIEKWEKKAKAGLLYHDATLGKVIMNMRSAVSETVDGISSNYNSIYSLGISTTGIKGQLVLDEDKLKTALANDPDAVYNVFAKLESTTTNSASAVYQTETDANGNVTVTSKSNGNGIAQRLGDIFVNATKLIKDRAGSSADITEDSDLNNLLRNLQTKMSNFKRIMNSFEDALYKKYDAMESTLAKLGMQLNYVMGSSGQ